MTQGVKAEDWSSILSELVRVLKPNGWIEWVEADIEIQRPGPMTEEFNKQLMSVMAENQQDAHISKSLKEKLAETGDLMNITSKFVSCPGGQWAGKVSLHFLCVCQTRIQSDFLF